MTNFWKDYLVNKFLMNFKKKGMPWNELVSSDISSLNNMITGNERINVDFIRPELEELFKNNNDYPNTQLPNMPEPRGGYIDLNN
jgi:hypothetical protein